MDLWMLDRGTGRESAPQLAVRGARRAAPDDGAPLVCVACGAVVTDRRNAISADGAHEHTFVNPAGIIYRVACFKSAPGCLEVGDFTEEHTWFPGYAWRYGCCASCAEHLGWVYRSADGDLFYGLVADKLAEGRPH